MAELNPPEVCSVYTVSTDVDTFNLPVLHTYLARQSHWAQGIPYDVFERSLRYSLCFGAFVAQPHCGGVQVGFARVISDRATFAYLCDVFTLPPWRGQGVARALMEAIAAHADLQGLRRQLLVTRDAAPLYRQYGFRALATPERFFEKTNVQPYSNQSALAS